MTQDKTEDLLFQISGKLAAIDSKLDTLSETILKHENRLSKLEETVSKIGIQREDGFKSRMLELLSKCLIISLTAIVSLIGAGGLLTKILTLN